jgi:Tfp pilus assembly protein PilF
MNTRRTGPRFAAVLLLVLPACSQVMPTDQKKEVRQHWSETRGRMKYQMAQESFGNGQIEQAHQQIRESIALDPTSPASQVLLAKLLLEKGETAAASEALQNATRHGGDAPEIDFLCGLVAQRYSRFDDALRWYRKAAEREHTNAHYVNAVAEILVQLGRANEALDLIRARWTDFEQNATLRALAGSIYVLLGRYEEAADAYREAARIAPADEVLQLELGSVLAQAGQYEEGCEILTTVTAKNEQSPPSALVNLARCHLQLGRADQAKSILRRVVATAPQNAAAWSMLSRASIDSGDLITARRAARQAADLEPESADSALLLAYVCRLQKDHRAAVQALDRVLDQHPVDGLALYLRDESAKAMDAEGPKSP